MPFDIDLIPWKQDLPASVFAKWRECAETTSNLRGPLQTPEWVDYRWRPSTDTFLSVLSDGVDRMPIAVTPLAQNNYQLTFSVAGKRLGQIQVGGLLILGNVPLLPESDEVYLEFLKRLMASPSVESVQMLGVPKGTPYWKFLEDIQKANKEWIFYRPEYPSYSYHWIEMPASFEEYSQKFNAKERHNLKRELSQLEKHVGAPLDLVRVSNADQVAPFLIDARSVSEKSWQKHLVGFNLDQPSERQKVLESMAHRGTLRCYLLKGGKHACAYAVGFQSSSGFYFYETGYDDSLAKWSPGKALLHLILKDVFEINRPKLFYFGPGDLAYKKWFANRTDQEVTLLILKNNATNRAKVLAHQTFRKCTEVGRAVRFAAQRSVSALRKRIVRTG